MEGVEAFHRTARRIERTAGYVIVTRTRFQHGLFAHHPFTIDMADHPGAIRDPPVAGNQLNPFMRSVFDADVINPEPFRRLGLALFGQEIHRDADGNTVGHGTVLKEFLDHMLNLMGHVVRARAAHLFGAIKLR